ncbi:hypothetical protein IWZ01DRAFT_34256 [Phyllosticta capitalensis]
MQPLSQHRGALRIEERGKRCRWRSRSWLNLRAGASDRWAVPRLAVFVALQRAGTATSCACLPKPSAHSAFLSTASGCLRANFAGSSDILEAMSLPPRRSTSPVFFVGLPELPRHQLLAWAIISGVYPARLLPVDILFACHRPPPPQHQPLHPKTPPQGPAMLPPPPHHLFGKTPYSSVFAPSIIKAS